MKEPNHSKKENDSLEKRLDKIDQKANELSKEYSRIFYDFSARDQLMKITLELESLEFDIAYNPFKITVDDKNRLTQLRDDKEKMEKIIESNTARRESIGKEIDLLGEVRKKLLFDKDSWEEIKETVDSRYNRNRQTKPESSVELKLKQITNEIDSEIKKLKSFKTRVNQQDVAACIDKNFNTFNILMRSENKSIKTSKVEYFRIICPMIEIVKQNKYSAEKLYKSAY